MTKEQNETKDTSTTKTLENRSDDANNLREKLINELSDLSLSLSDSLEQVGETELESNRSVQQKNAGGERASK